MNAIEIHARLRGAWPGVLEQLGVPKEALRLRRAQPCPVCGGTDRFVFDDKQGRGNWICRHHRGGGLLAGDGFRLLQEVHGWNFATARAEVIRVAGLDSSSSRVAPPARTAAPLPVLDQPAIAMPTPRVRRALSQSCPVEDCADVQDYLDSRALWPLPAGHQLRAHAALPYFAEGGAPTGLYSALLAPVRDVDGELVTLHVTWLADGKKAPVKPARKVISGTQARKGVAVRLATVSGNVLGIAEGIETALAAMRLHGVPTWSALDAGHLAKFEPPRGVERLVVFADRDEAGLAAAARLAARLQQRLKVEISPPPAPLKDWNDALCAKSGRR